MAFLFSSRLLWAFLSLYTLHAACSTFSPARPPAIPLAVRSPYLSTWLQVGSDGGNGGYLAGQWPTFWNGATTAWTGLIRVDGKTYTWMGNPNPLPACVTQTAFEYTSTRSIFTQNVNGLVGLTVTFRSPVTPEDYVVGSLVSSYMHVSVRSLDGKKHDVQLYTDISAQWVSGDLASEVEWDFGVSQASASPADAKVQARDLPNSAPGLSRQHGRRHAHHRRAEVAADPNLASSTNLGSSTATSLSDSIANTTTSATVTTITVFRVSPVVSANATDELPLTATATNVRFANLAAASGIAYHHISRKQQIEFAECNQQTQYGQWYYMTKSTAKLTHQSGEDTKVRGRFVHRGNLANTKDTRYRAIQDDWPVFAYAVDLGSVGSVASDTTFTIGLNQQNAIRFQGAQGIQNVPALWTSHFATDLSANTWFYKQYSDNLAKAKALDKKIHSDSQKAGGSKYPTITSLAVRQAFGALQFAGTPSDIKLFLKEIASDGNIQTVDVIFPFHPIILYLNPELLKFMLNPLYINQEAGHWPYKFSIHDLGSSYPNATGHPKGNAEQQPLEECGDMVIMSLAYAQRANDNAWLSKNYPLLHQWSRWLIDEALIPFNQLSTDDFAGPIANQTNLALKGIIAIEAMARIATRTGHHADATRFSSVAHDYITKWQVYGVAKGTAHKHTTLDYGQSDTFSLLYNLFADKLLGLDLVPQTIYDMQSKFYPHKALEYGVPLHNRHDYTKVDWEMFCAAVASVSTRDLFINRIAKYINRTPTNGPFSDLYNASSGNFPPGLAFQARPVVGGEFALLALNSAP